MGKDMMRVKDLIGKMKSANTNYVKLYDGITYETVYRGTDKGLFSNYENTKKEVVSFHVENNCLCICVPHEEEEEKTEEESIENISHGMVLMQNIE